jgi:uncharacterized protein (DUF849 family)
MDRAALAGAYERERYPMMPITGRDIVWDRIAAAAGAVISHVHADDPATGPNDTSVGLADEDHICCMQRTRELHERS